MSELTAAQAEDESNRLELAAASALGLALFEFSRLEVQLALLLVWSESGARLSELTSQLNESSLHDKLCLLDKLVAQRFPVKSAERTRYEEWQTSARRAKAFRNQLVHSRWGTDPYKSEVLSIVGIPNSPEQRESRYTIPALEALVHEARDLQRRLQVLRAQCPL